MFYGLSWIWRIIHQGGYVFTCICCFLLRVIALQSTPMLFSVIILVIINIINSFIFSSHFAFKLLQHTSTEKQPISQFSVYLGHHWTFFLLHIFLNIQLKKIPTSYYNEWKKNLQISQFHLFPCLHSLKCQSTFKVLTHTIISKGRQFFLSFIDSKGHFCLFTVLGTPEWANLIGGPIDRSGSTSYLPRNVIQLLKWQIFPIFQRFREHAIQIWFFEFFLNHHSLKPN